MVANGRKLILLDEMVIDVKDYMKAHPGGKFLIENNIGRDISKFFYGGQSQESLAGMRPYLHSNIAFDMINQLTKYKLEKEAENKVSLIIDRSKITNSTSAFTFKFLNYCE